MRDRHIELMDDYLLEIADFSVAEHWDYLECIDKVVSHLKRSNALKEGADSQQIELLYMMAYAHKQGIRVIQNMGYRRSTGRRLVDDF